MKTLILAEKPSVGKEIARILGCRQNLPGALTNSNYLVTWALGHLVTLAMPEEYSKAWEEWTVNTLPMLPEKFKTVVIKETSKQYSLVKNYLRSNEVKDVIIATDAGREGELVARWIIYQAGISKPLKRLWISSMTDTAIKQGFNSLKPASAYDNLYQSALARAKADWLVGLNVTRALTCKYNAQLSAGRVQTPTLAMIVERENEINKFRPVPYYQILFNYQETNRLVRFTYNLKNETRIYQVEEAEKLFKALNNQQAIVKKVEKKEKRSQFPLLYDLTELQRDANKIYGFSPKMTLDLMQALYERHKVLTYPRTDSKYLTTDMYSQIKSRLQNVEFGDYQKIVREILAKPIVNSKRIFDNQKVSDHHAIIPTDVRPNIANLNASERRIYELVVKRFLAVFLPDYEYYETTVSLQIGNSEFSARGSVVKNLGWKKVYQKNEIAEEEDYQVMPNFTEGAKLAGKLELKKSLTTPPARYTEATLLSAMEHPAKFVSSNQAKTILEDTGGLGTPATRADIIEKLFNSGYLELKGKSIYPTSKATQLISLAPDKLRSPMLTADYETRLKKISEGKERADLFVESIVLEVKQLVVDVLNSNNTYRHDNLTKKTCPLCGKNLLEVKTKSGTSLVCMDRNCKYRQTISKHSELRCPNCKKKLDLIGNDDNKYYLCQCGYREKASSLEQKLFSRKKEMSKREVGDYLKNQNKEIPKDNPFADFFKK